MGFRGRVVALFCLVVLLLFGAHAAEAARYRSPVQQLRQSSKPAVVERGQQARHTRRSVHRKLGEKQSRLEFSVDSYGAVGDGKHDDTASFQKAWAAVCGSSKPATLVVPKEKKYLVQQITFVGQCKAKQVTFKLEGQLVAPKTRSGWTEESNMRWVEFSGVDGLTVTGGGTLDGNGKVWWGKSCRVDKHLACSQAPTALLLNKCKHLKVEDIKLLNSQQMHMSVEACDDVTLSHVTITAPGDSPNTDGIHIARSTGVRLSHCDIKTGDDCISIETGTKDLYAEDITCGPGHGISIGSLGDDNSEAQVSNITIHNAHLTGSTNGARIKTWQGGRGYAKDITFENIVMDKVKNPIVIDQNYCTMADPLNPKPCKAQKSAVEVSSVHFKNIQGTSATKEAIRLDCSSSLPCHDITFEDVNLSFKKRPAASVCRNAKLSNTVNSPGLSDSTADSAS